MTRHFAKRGILASNDSDVRDSKLLEPTTIAPALSDLMTQAIASDESPS